MSPWITKIDPLFGGRMLIPWTDHDQAGGEVTVTASGTAHTKGSWVELVSAANNVFDIGCIWLHSSANSASGTNTSQLCDIGLGAAASEAVIIPDILTGFDTLRASEGMRIPIFIPKGERIAARIQAAITSDTLGLQIALVEAGNYPSFQRAENIGSLSGTSGGTDIEGTGWTEMKAATDDDIDALVPMWDLGGSSLGGNVADNEIAVGPSSSEVQIAPPLNGAGTYQKYGIVASSSSSESINGCDPRSVLPGVGPIPSGTRISGRQGTGSDRVDGFALIGLSGAK